MNKNIPIKGVIFDLDNTLLDFMKMKEVAVKSAIRGMIEAYRPISGGSPANIAYAKDCGMSMMVTMTAATESSVKSV